MLVHICLSFPIHFVTHSLAERFRQTLVKRSMIRRFVSCSSLIFSALSFSQSLMHWWCDKDLLYFLFSFLFWYSMICRYRYPLICRDMLMELWPSDSWFFPLVPMYASVNLLLFSSFHVSSITDWTMNVCVHARPCICEWKTFKDCDNWLGCVLM